MKPTNDLRPVELLNLLYYAGEGEITSGSALAATLSYLITEGYIGLDGKDFYLTRRGRGDRDNMRKYEIELLDVIDGNDEFIPFNPINGFFLISHIKMLS